MPYVPGIHTWDQVDSVVRRIGETELAIRAEKNRCNEAILEIKKTSDRCIENWTHSQAELFVMIDNFAKEHYSAKSLYAKKMQFGLVKIRKSSVIIEPDYGNILKERGKP